MLSGPAPAPVLALPNQRFSLDFVHDQMSSGRRFRVLNIGSDAPVRLAELVDAIEAAVGRDIVREYLPVQPGDVPHTHADVSRAKSTPGWAPAMTLTEGLRRYVAWVEAGEP